VERDYRIRRHPARRDLVAYAETLVDGRAPVSAAMAAHVAGCPQCTAEVKAVRSSLELTASAPALCVSNTLTAQILMRAQQESRAQESVRRRHSTAMMAVKSVVYVSGMAAVIVLVFSLALDEARGHEGGASPLRLAVAAGQDEGGAVPSTFDAAAFDKLSAAVRLGPSRPQSPREREHWRAVSALDADIEAAMRALERNPGCARASRMVEANRQRQAEALRSLYIERTL